MFKIRLAHRPVLISTCPVLQLVSKLLKRGDLIKSSGCLNSLFTSLTENDETWQDWSGERLLARLCATGVSSSFPKAITKGNLKRVMLDTASQSIALRNQRILEFIFSHSIL